MTLVTPANHDPGWKLDELAQHAGVSPRTVRYYVQRGLLPAPVFRGRDTEYTRSHLVRLRAIKRLQEHFLPLDAIQVELEGRSPADIERIADGHVLPAGAAAPVPPAGVASPRVARSAHSTWERFALAAGLELHVSEAADEATRALADEVRRWVERRRAPGGSSR